MQNVNDAFADPNVQHWSLVESVQSADVWQMTTFEVSLQSCPRWVLQAAAVVHDVPTDVGLQFG